LANICGEKKGLNDMSLYADCGPGVPNNCAVDSGLWPAYGNNAGLFATKQKSAFVRWHRAFVRQAVATTTYESEKSVLEIPTCTGEETPEAD